MSYSAMASPPGDNFIEVKDLVAAYDGKVVVESISFGVRQGEHVSLLGPSGCGKSTTLRCIAGLETPLAGRILIGGTTMFCSEGGINLPPEKRNLAMVFQSYAIWPHMTVFENVAFGLRARGVPREELRTRVERAVTMIGMSAMIDRPATELSGGQQQRVALARAYATTPAAILLDEPLSNLDARLRVRMRDEMKDLQARMRLATLYVTHDQEEAMAMSDRIIVMREGIIEQEGLPLEIYEKPRSRFVADFLGGANLVEGRLVEEGSTLLQVGDAIVQCRRDIPGANTAAGSLHCAAIHTAFPVLSRKSDETGRNQWPAKIVRRDLLGNTVGYQVAWPGGLLRVNGTPNDIFNEGEDLFVSIAAEHAVLLSS